MPQQYFLSAHPLSPQVSLRDFLCHPSEIFLVSFLCLRPKKSSCAACPERDAPLKIKITSFHSLSHSIVPKMFPVLSAESALYYVQYSRNEPPFCKPYARRRFPFHTDKSPRYSFCFFLSVLNLFKKKIFLFSHNIQPRSKRFANVFATSQFFQNRLLSLFCPQIKTLLSPFCFSPLLSFCPHSTACKEKTFPC